MSRSDTEKDDVEAVKNIQRASYVLIFSICGLTLVVKRDNMVAMWALKSSGMLPAVLQIVLFLCAIGLVIRWIAATAHEFQLWLGNLQYAFVKSHAYTAMLGLAVILGMMLILTYDILAFTGFFSCYLLFLYWTQWVSIEHFERALNRTHVNLGEKQDKILGVLRIYWLRRPQLARVVTMMFVSQFSFALALKSSGGGPYAQPLLSSAYIIAICNIIAGEVIISRWRSARDRDLQALVDSDQNVNGAGLQ
jgi:hypothetical protein